MKTITQTLILLLFVSTCYAQDYYQEFAQYCQAGDKEKQLEVLKKWDLEETKSGNYYAAYFNYYILQAKQEVLGLQSTPHDGEQLALQDSTGKTVGYMGNQLFFHPGLLEKAYAKIDEGIRLHPDRLDLWFGKIHTLRLVKKWPEFTEEVIKVIKRSAENNNKWTWTNDEKKEDGKNFLLASLQDYQLTLYNTQDDALLTNMREIALAILEEYPKHIESLSNVSITYLLTKEYDKGLEYLLKAEAIAPTDAIVLSNIATSYEYKKDLKKAITYYEKAAKHGDQEIKGFCQSKIKELKKKEK